jgi:hypothetical protein
MGRVDASGIKLGAFCFTFQQNLSFSTFIGWYHLNLGGLPGE